MAKVEKFITGIERVPAGGNVSVKVNFKNPEKPGNYLSVFRFVHGKGIEFGDKAYADIKVVEKPKPTNIEDEIKKVMAIKRSEMMLDKFENVDKLEKSFEMDDDAKSVESNEIQIIDDPVIVEVEPVQ